MAADGPDDFYHGLLASSAIGKKTCKTKPPASGDRCCNWHKPHKPSWRGKSRGTTDYRLTASRYCAYCAGMVPRRRLPSRPFSKCRLPRLKRPWMRWSGSVSYAGPHRTMMKHPIPMNSLLEVFTQRAKRFSLNEAAFSKPLNDFPQSFARRPAMSSNRWSPDWCRIRRVSVSIVRSVGRLMRESASSREPHQVALFARRIAPTLTRTLVKGLTTVPGGARTGHRGSLK